MPEILNKVKSVPNICGIDFASTGTLLPSSIEGYQVFANSIPLDTDFEKAYASLASVSFGEESETGAAGPSYKQKLVIKFPATDSQRSERLAFMHKVKFVKVKLTNNKHFALGRNDFEQNAKPVVTIKTNEKTAQVEFNFRSINPVGYTPPIGIDGLPIFFPLNFVNPD